MIKPELSFEKDDKFHRELYADFLLEICQKQEGSEGGYTLAVDAAYGSGKTWFLKMLMSKIKKEFERRNRPLTAVYYDAWKYDYFDEPFEPLVQQIMPQEAMADELKANNASRRFGKFVAALKGAGLKIGRQAPFDVFAAAIDAAKEYKEAGEAQAERLIEYDAHIKDFKDMLADAIKIYGKNGRLLVIVDELDRCRPDFAVRTLEITKHLLSVPGIVFLYAVDITQLRKTVESMYGVGMDAEGYLLRFFDYISVMPAPSTRDYIRDILQGFVEEDYLDDLTMEFAQEKSDFGLSLRDIDRILGAYQVMHNLFLKEYNHVHARKLYLLLLTMKYKTKDLFDALMVQNKGEFDIKMVPRRRRPNEADMVLGSISYLGKFKKIELDEDRSVLNFERLVTDAKEHFWHDGNCQYFFKANADGKINIGAGKIICDGSLIRIPEKEICIDLLLFIPDIEKMLKIKNLPMTYNEYVHQQLEMFNFRVDEQPKQS